MFSPEFSHEIRPVLPVDLERQQLVTVKSRILRVVLIIEVAKMHAEEKHLWGVFQPLYLDESSMGKSLGFL